MRTRPIAPSRHAAGLLAACGCLTLVGAYLSGLARAFDTVSLVVMTVAVVILAAMLGPARRRLRSAERELQLLADHMTDVVTRAGFDGVLRYVSPSCLGALGWRPEELVGRSFLEVVHPDDVGHASVARGTRRGETVTTRHRVRRPDGSYVWFESTAQLVLGTDGKPEILSWGRDVTERLITDAASVASPEAYHDGIGRAAEGVLVLDAEGRISYANERMAAMLGTSPAELLGRPAGDFMDPEGAAAAAARLEQRRAGLGGSAETKIVGADGTERWVWATAAPVFDVAGHYQGLVALASDFTERHLEQAAVARREARYRALLDRLPDTMILVYDQDLHLVFAGGAGLAERGHRAADLIGRPVEEVVDPADLGFLRPLYEAALRGESTTTEFSSHRNGVQNLLDVVPIPSEEGGLPAEILVVARDIGHIKQRELALVQAEERWRIGFDLSRLGMAEVGLDGRYLKVNQALCDFLGYPEEELVGARVAGFVHPEERHLTDAAMTAFASGRTRHRRTERRYVRADGRTVWAAVAATALGGPAGPIDHLLVHVFDITERKSLEDQLRHLADHDPHTDLLNRRSFERELDYHTNHAPAGQPRGALLLLDIDNFKRVNDTLGHTAGDRVIVALAKVLRDQLRGSDTVARLGGDEFAVILPHATAAQAEQIAGGVVAAVRQEVVLLPDGNPVTVTASIGVALFDESVPGAEVLSRADSALYAAKRAGRDRHVAYAAVHPGGERLS